MSSLKVDNITGRGNAGFTGSVKSEGGNTTTDLQQGLAKAWLQFNQSTLVKTGSFNITDVTDGGDGDFTPNFTNNMSALDYAVTSAGGQLNQDAGGRISETNPTNTSSYQCVTTNSGGTRGDHTGNSNATFGDLA